MKTHYWRSIGASIVVLVMVVSIAISEEQPASVNNSTSTNIPASTPPADADLVSTQRIYPAPVPLPSELAEVARLIMASVDQGVILAYVQKTPLPQPVSAEQIVYLRDLGLSSSVLKELIEQGAREPTGTAPPPALSPESETQTPISEPTVIEPETATPPAEAPAEQPQAPTVSGDAATYYEALAPYGTWINVPGYGWCWQPTVAVVQPAWQPYYDNGNWLWSDHGWYWDSHYSWGWAPFHYGRWWHYPRYGWLWYPDRVWGPSWVCWRTWEDYCGWAPLPPGACFTAGAGWAYCGAGVGFDFGFHLPWSCFAFVHYGHFHDRDWHRHCVRGSRAEDIYGHSRVNNHYMAGPGGHPMNRGIDPSRIESATRTALKPVPVGEKPFHSAAGSLGTRRSAPPGGLASSSLGTPPRQRAETPATRSQTPSARVLAQVSRPAITSETPSRLSSPIGSPGIARSSPPNTLSSSPASSPRLRAEAPIIRSQAPSGSTPALASRPMMASRASSGLTSSIRPPGMARSAPSSGLGLSPATSSRVRAEAPASRVTSPVFRAQNASPLARSTPSAGFRSSYSGLAPSARMSARPAYASPSYSSRSAPMSTMSRPSFSHTPAPSYARSYQSRSISSRPTTSFNSSRGTGFSSGGPRSSGGGAGRGGQGFHRR